MSNLSKYPPQTLRTIEKSMLKNLLYDHISKLATMNPEQQHTIDEFIANTLPLIEQMTLEIDQLLMIDDLEEFKTQVNLLIGKKFRNKVVLFHNWQSPLSDEWQKLHDAIFNLMITQGNKLQDKGRELQCHAQDYCMRVIRGFKHCIEWNWELLSQNQRKQLPRYISSKLRAGFKVLANTKKPTEQQFQMVMKWIKPMEQVIEELLKIEDAEMFKTQVNELIGSNFKGNVAPFKYWKKPLFEEYRKFHDTTFNLIIMAKKLQDKGKVLGIDSSDTSMKCIGQFINYIDWNEKLLNEEQLEQLSKLMMRLHISTKLRKEFNNLNKSTNPNPTQLKRATELIKQMEQEIDKILKIDDRQMFHDQLFKLFRSRVFWPEFVLFQDWQPPLSGDRKTFHQAMFNLMLKIETLQFKGETLAISSDDSCMRSIKTFTNRIQWNKKLLSEAQFELLAGSHISTQLFIQYRALNKSHYPSNYLLKEATRVVKLMQDEINRLLVIQDKQEFDQKARELFRNKDFWNDLAPFRYWRRPLLPKQQKLLDASVDLMMKVDALLAKGKTLGISLQDPCLESITAFTNCIEWNEELLSKVQREQLASRRLSQSQLLIKLFREASNNPAILVADLAKKYFPLSLSPMEIDQSIQQVEQTGEQISAALKFHYQVLAPLGYGLTLLSKNQDWTFTNHERTLEAAEKFNKLLDAFVQRRLYHTVSEMGQQLAKQILFRSAIIPTQQIEDHVWETIDPNMRKQLYRELLSSHVRLKTLTEAGLIAEPEQLLLKSFYQPILLGREYVNESLALSIPEKRTFFNLIQHVYPKRILGQVLETSYPVKQDHLSSKPHFQMDKSQVIDIHDRSFKLNRSPKTERAKLKFMLHDHMKKLAAIDPEQQNYQEILANARSLVEQMTREINQLFEIDSKQEFDDRLRELIGSNIFLEKVSPFQF